MIMNNTLSEHELNDFGTGILSPLPEPNTERCSLRPIILPEIIRKVLSEILLN